MKWLIVTLIIILAFLVTIIYIPVVSNNSVLDISQKNLNSIIENIPEGSDFLVCSMKNDDCVVFKKISDING